MAEQSKGRLSSDPSKSKCSKNIIRTPAWVTNHSDYCGTLKVPHLGKPLSFGKTGIFGDHSPLFISLCWLLVLLSGKLIAKMITGSSWLVQLLLLVTPEKKGYLNPNNPNNFLGIALICQHCIKWPLQINYWARGIRYLVAQPGVGEVNHIFDYLLYKME